MNTPIPGSVEFWAAKTPDAAALREGTRSLSYAEWNAQADRLAELFATRAHVAAGDHVALCMQNRLEWFVTQAAAAKLGAALVPISSRLTPAEIHYIAADCCARVFLFDAEDADALSRVWTNEPATDRPSSVQIALGMMRSARTDVLSFAEVCATGQAPARYAQKPPRAIVYTSGTTGRPRGVVHARTPPKAADKPRPEPARDAAPIRTELLRNLLGAPLNHAAGQASARATHVIGGCVHIMPRFDAKEALRIIDREKITTTFCVPTMLNRIVSLPPELLAAHDVSSIRVITTGASPCPQSVKEQVIAYFGPHCLVESYGTTEVGIIARMRPEDHLRKPGACGRVIEQVEVQIRDAAGNVLPRGEVGEIYVRTPYMIARYLNEGAPRELIEGYFATGDVGRFDADDFLYVVDRKKDMIIAGGVNIYPAEIEDALRKHPAVFDAAAFGVPHADLGEEVRAVVECVESANVSEAELLAFVADQLAAYKRPRAIDFVREIPRNPAGKILKRQLREPYWANSEKRI
jgi:long-chain acyl-CoA synthetase